MQAAAQTHLSCPNQRCGKPVRTDQDDPWCHECGEYFPADFAANLPRLVARRAASAGGSGSSWQPTGRQLEGPALQKATPRARAVMRRYSDAYRVATVIVNVGETIKVVGFSLAIIFGLFGLFAWSRAGMFGLFAGFFSAAFFGVMSWLSGVLINSQGQQLIASLDGAVSASPFLTDDERAETMSLPEATGKLETPNPGAAPDG